MPGPIANATISDTTSKYEQMLAFAMSEAVDDRSPRRAGSIPGYVGFVVN